MNREQTINYLDHQKLILFWKGLIGVDLDDKKWDKVFFPMYARTAVSLVELFGLGNAMECCEYIKDWMEKKKLDYTFHTVLKRSDLFREHMNKKGAG